jgi:hypothetical protein
VKEEEKMSAERERRVKQIVLRTLRCIYYYVAFIITLSLLRYCYYVILLRCIRTQVNFCPAFELQKNDLLK